MRNASLVAGSADGCVQSVLRVAIANRSSFAFVAVSLADEFVKSCLGIEYKVAVAHFSNGVQNLLSLRPVNQDSVFALVRGLVVLWAVRPGGFVRVDL